MQEAHIKKEQSDKIKYHPVINDLIEQIAIEARQSDFVDVKSGVSARLTISAFENLISAAERRALVNGEKETYVRVADFWGVMPSITGKIELVYEGEQEGPFIVAQNLISKSVRSMFLNYFPDPEKFKKKKIKGDAPKLAEKPSPYLPISGWFGNGNMVDILVDMPNKDYEKILNSIPGLKEVVGQYQSGLDYHAKLFMMEFALHGLAEYSIISKNRLDSGLQFKDLFSSMFSPSAYEEDDRDLPFK